VYFGIGVKKLTFTNNFGFIIVIWNSLHLMSNFPLHKKNYEIQSKKKKPLQINFQKKSLMNIFKWWQNEKRKYDLYLCVKFKFEKFATLLRKFKLRISPILFFQNYYLSFLQKNIKIIWTIMAFYNHLFTCFKTIYYYFLKNNAHNWIFWTHGLTNFYVHLIYIYINQWKIFGVMV
jgi:hypothetical protein